MDATWALKSPSVDGVYVTKSSLQVQLEPEQPIFSNTLALAVTSFRSRRCQCEKLGLRVTSISRSRWRCCHGPLPEAVVEEIEEEMSVFLELIEDEDDENEPEVEDSPIDPINEIDTEPGSSVKQSIQGGQCLGDVA
jgi:hypothetical protein